MIKKKKTEEMKLEMIYGNTKLKFRFSQSQVNGNKSPKLQKSSTPHLCIRVDEVFPQLALKQTQRVDIFQTGGQFVPERWALIREGLLSPSKSLKSRNCIISLSSISIM